VGGNSDCLPPRRASAFPGSCRLVEQGDLPHDTPRSAPHRPRGVSVGRTCGQAAARCLADSPTEAGATRPHLAVVTYVRLREKSAPCHCVSKPRRRQRLLIPPARPLAVTTIRTRTRLTSNTPSSPFSCAHCRKTTQPHRQPAPSAL
jgi:hypothetical protein